MNKLLLFCILFNLNSMFICAEPKYTADAYHADIYPVDISYLVADVKYSQEHGLKICEVQHGSLSALDGDLYISGQGGTISPLIADFFVSFPIKNGQRA